MADEELDPRIQLELEKLNTETAEINKLELELEEANTTFRMLLNEATRRLKGLAQRLGTSVDRARPYHEGLTAAQDARAACQRAAVAYQRASEIHAAAKETVALAEQRFKSNQHEWQFDSAWQEMLNHATIKVMDAENQKSDSGREHHKRAQLFNTAETRLQQLEDQLRKYVLKSRPYFDEKQLCQEQLATQKERIEYLQDLISKAKFRYSQSLKMLEAISEEIHMKRRDMYDDSVGEYPVGPREPGVGAENYTDYSLELEMNDLGLRSKPHVNETEMNDEAGTLEELRRRVRRLAARPVEGGETGDIAWETELNETVNRLDQMLMMREKAQQAKVRDRCSPMPYKYVPEVYDNTSSLNSDESSPPSSSQIRPDTSTQPECGESSTADEPNTTSPIKYVDETPILQKITTPIKRVDETPLLRIMQLTEDIDVSDGKQLTGGDDVSEKISVNIVNESENVNISQTSEELIAKISSTEPIEEVISPICENSDLNVNVDASGKLDVVSEKDFKFVPLSYTISFDDTLNGDSVKETVYSENAPGESNENFASLTTMSKVLDERESPSGMSVDQLIENENVPSPQSERISSEMADGVERSTELGMSDDNTNIQN
ncbi:SH3 domain-binding protein 5 homolog [Arctopsyche grandis]|uniref:SH3 domain-binding protein 5 homolog n=1 Tax=Arctopsyche grandis TaxID=121162 RepID=UPI00406D99C9